VAVVNRSDSDWQTSYQANTPPQSQSINGSLECIVYNDDDAFFLNTFVLDGSHHCVPQRPQLWQ
jgi:hypothetical protein